MRDCTKRSYRMQHNICYRSAGKDLNLSSQFKQHARKSEWNATSIDLSEAQSYYVRLLYHLERSTENPLSCYCISDANIGLHATKICRESHQSCQLFIRSWLTVSH